MFINAVKEPCAHKIKNSFFSHTHCVVDDGSPQKLLITVAEGLLRTNMSGKKTGLRKIAHSYLARFEKTEKRAGIHVVFSRPDGLFSQCKWVNKMGRSWNAPQTTEIISRLVLNVWCIRSLSIVAALV